MVWASSFSTQRLLSSEIYSESSYSSRQRLSGIQPYLKAKLVRPASRISPSWSNTQLRPYLKERTMASFRRYRRIYSYTEYTRTQNILVHRIYSCTEFLRDKFPRLPDDWDLLKWYFILKELLSMDARKVLSKYLPNRFKCYMILLYLQNILQSKSLLKTRSLPSGSPASMLT